MTYATQETSTHSGQPVELYRFALGTPLCQASCRLHLVGL